MWLNLRGFGDVLDPITRDRMFVGAVARHRIGRDFSRSRARASRPPRRADQRRDPVDHDGAVGGRADRGAGPGPAAAGAGAADAAGRPRVRSSTSRCAHPMLMLDGASLEVIFSGGRGRPAAEHRRASSIKGAVLHLATLRPTQAEPVWSAIATGRYPMSNGVRSAVVYRALGGTPIQLLPDYCFAQALVTFGFLSEQPQTANDLLARPIWNILSDRGASVGVIGWPLTQPAPAVNGFVGQRCLSSLAGNRAQPRCDAGAVAARAAGRCAAPRCRRRPIPIRSLLVNAMGAPQPVNDYDVRSDQAPIVADRVHLQLLNALETPAPRLSGGAISWHRCRRPPLSALCRSVGVWRRVGSRAREVRRRAESVLRLHRHAGRPRDRAARARTICCWWSRRSAWSR